MTQAATRSGQHFHAVQFYADDTALCSIVAAFLTEGFTAGHPALVIATPDHCAGIEAQLRQHGQAVETLKDGGDFVLLDARATLPLFMRDGLPHSRAFHYVAGQIIEKVCDGRTHCTVRAYGEMVNLLWQDGLETAAIRLETLWNELANTHDFKLLCGYAMGNFYKGAAIEDIKGQHSHLTSDIGEHAPL